MARVVVAVGTHSCWTPWDRGAPGHSSQGRCPHASFETQGRGTRRQLLLLHAPHTHPRAPLPPPCSPLLPPDHSQKINPGQSLGVCGLPSSPQRSHPGPPCMRPPHESSTRPIGNFTPSTTLSVRVRASRGSAQLPAAPLLRPIAPHRHSSLAAPPARYPILYTHRTPAQG